MGLIEFVKICEICGKTIIYSRVCLFRNRDGKAEQSVIFLSLKEKIISIFLSAHSKVLKMEVKAQNTGLPVAMRINSVDFFRGLTMFLLAGETTGIYYFFSKFDGGFMQFLATQFTHHKWHGLHFWDLIQPFFMFIVGVSIPFAVANRLKKGDSSKTITLHAMKRSFLLLF